MLKQPSDIPNSDISGPDILPPDILPPDILLPDSPLADIPLADIPPSDIPKLKATWIKAGYCTHPEAIAIQGGRWQSIRFPALVVLLQHPNLGNILFDTGYAQHFFQETQQWPNRLYALITPVHLQSEESASQQLQQQGITADSIRYIVISHFHADHVGGLKDFPNAEFICAKSAYEAVKHQKGWGAVTMGFLPGLLPPDFEQRVRFVEQMPQVEALPGWFDQGFDVGGDRSLIAVELPGHATGQLGLLFTDSHDQRYFLVADACWSSRAYQELTAPHPLAQLIFSDTKAYHATLRNLHDLNKKHPEIHIVPTHCSDVWHELRTQGSLRTLGSGPPTISH